MTELARVGAFCPNCECAAYGRIQDAQQTNIIKYGLTKAGRQRFHCRTCGQTFAETKGTLFYRRRTTESEILTALALIAEGSRISSVSRTTGHKEDTILAWLRDAAEQVDAVEAVLLADYEVSRGQLDGLWAYVGHKDEKTMLPTAARSGAPP